MPHAACAGCRRSRTINHVCPCEHRLTMRCAPAAAVDQADGLFEHTAQATGRVGDILLGCAGGRVAAAVRTCGVKPRRRAEGAQAIAAVKPQPQRIRDAATAGARPYMGQEAVQVTLELGTRQPRLSSDSVGPMMQIADAAGDVRTCIPCMMLMKPRLQVLDAIGRSRRPVHRRVWQQKHT